MNVVHTLITGSFTCLFIAIFLIFCKVHYLNSFRKKYHRYVRLKIFGLFKDEDIYSTSSSGKKGLMVTCNRITAAIYACLLPVSLGLTSLLVFKIVALLDSIQ